MFRTLSKMAENAAKRLKVDNAVTIGTHNGTFHADEALAVHMLRQLPTYASASLIRTRDPARLQTCHTVVDVGGEYDASKHRYDHHQRTFDTTFPDRATKLSSAGLVYMHFGKALIAQRLNQSEDSETVCMVWKKLYESFIEAVDAHDNGIPAYDPELLQAAGIEKRYTEGAYGLGAVVGRFNPQWNDEVPEDPVEAQAAEDERFEAASKRIGSEFDHDLDYYTGAWLPARSVVQEAFDKRMAIHPQGHIMVIEGRGAPWKDHIFAIEEELKTEEQNRPLYVLFPETPRPDSRWRIQAVPVSRDSFQSRKPLPTPWRGMRDEALDEITGVPGCIFTHASGFIGGAKTYEGALALAEKACLYEEKTEAKPE
ncbi:putative UPF0160 protein C27H6.8 [Xylaria nigripes]|nr:putative UPF0160 protein C27H6.8 [Xylaria nigripes]